jgi:hypothetical protein
MSLTGGCAVQALWEGKRLDGRGLMDGRDIDITFGLDWGSCQVTLGRSRVLAQVSHPSKHMPVFVPERKEVFYTFISPPPKKKNKNVFSVLLLL